MAESSKMVLTKSEEFSNQLSQQSVEIGEIKTLISSLGVTLNQKIDGLNKTTAALEGHIDQVSKDITNKVDQLDINVRSEIAGLKNADAELLHSFESFQRDTTGTIGNIQKM